MDALIFGVGLITSTSMHMMNNAMAFFYLVSGRVGSALFYYRSLFARERQVPLNLFNPLDKLGDRLTMC